ncbi:hypothetical protein CFOL_v3_14691 [Cephalotus follicularis]|uniref:Uncharacterized protein n=1 Tax=Cephalotus follicularis TaxID=3775 RepID=A0A1Q3BTA8_CEPFO|nr:hypothetical protein CFOL_v3_14691 [Cephalotus follicularis]
MAFDGGGFLYKSLFFVSLLCRVYCWLICDGGLCVCGLFELNLMFAVFFFWLQAMDAFFLYLVWSCCFGICDCLQRMWLFAGDEAVALSRLKTVVTGIVFVCD